MTRFIAESKEAGQLKKQLTPQLKKGIIKEKSIPALLKEAQKIFNTWVRNRDKDLPCICCGSFNTSEAAHYFSQGHYGALRFNEMNVNLCCTRCNCFLSGNLIKYRQGLVKKYGEEKVLALENSVAIRTVKKWSRLELKLIMSIYSIKK